MKRTSHRPFQLLLCACASTRDAEGSKLLHDALTPGVRSGLLNVVTADGAAPGEARGEYFATQLRSADAVLVFLSVDFFADSWLESVVWPALLQARQDRSLPLLLLPWRPFPASSLPVLRDLQFVAAAEKPWSSLLQSKREQLVAALVERLVVWAQNGNVESEDLRSGRLPIGELIRPRRLSSSRQWPTALVLCGFGSVTLLGATLHIWHSRVASTGAPAVSSPVGPSPRSPSPLKTAAGAAGFDGSARLLPAPPPARLSQQQGGSSAGRDNHSVNIQVAPGGSVNYYLPPTMRSPADADRSPAQNPSARPPLPQNPAGSQPPPSPGHSCTPNLLQNGDFREEWSTGWERRFDSRSMLHNASQIRVERGAGMPMLYMRFDGKNSMYLEQTVPLPRTGTLGQWLLDAEVEFHAWEGPIIGFSGSGHAELALLFLDESSRLLGSLHRGFYVKNALAATGLPGVPTGPVLSGSMNFRLLPPERLQHISLNLLKEIRETLPAIDPRQVAQVTVRARVGASDERAGAEAWFGRLRFRVCS